MGRRAGSESVVAIIPARLDSTRFPRKALANETGTALVVHVCHAAARGERVSRVVVATDSEEIARVVREGGFEAVMTGDHPNGTSRLVEAAERLKLKASAVVVNVQGDEPEIETGVIDGAVEAVCDERAWEFFPEASPRNPAVGTVASPMGPDEDPDDPNLVKVVTGELKADRGIGQALYFSRRRIPSGAGEGGAPCLRHVGIYAYGVRDLRRYPKLTPTPLEQVERLEQLRWLEHGYPIAVAIRDSSHVGIDTPEQYAAFVERWRAKNP